jgi:ABC-type thiamin/hydroxymethylpyrimidine transport system permease subunit
MGTRQRMDVRDLVLVALLSAVGGVLSTYVGYIGNLINRLFGVPFGAGQLIAGVHVIWPLLARVLIGRFGSGTMTGILKGLVEFLSGGTHGVVILLVSAVQGIFVDVGMSTASRQRLDVMMLTGGVASASNVFVFQALYFSGVPWSFILGMAALAFVSGLFFGGFLAWDLHALLRESNLVARQGAVDSRRPRPKKLLRSHLLTLLVVVAALAGAAYYYLQVADPFSSPDAVSIQGSVSAPYTYRPATWEGDVVTVRAEMQGSITTIPARDYTGPLLRDVLLRAAPHEDASSVRVIASDGYEVQLVWSEIMADERILLTVEEGTVRLVAAAYEGSFWVQRVSRLVVR